MQFALTTMFHINWAVLSVGLSLFLVVLEALWLKTGDEDYYRHARFWGRLFVLNFAVGVVSGVPLEFQFGANWARFAATTGGFFGNILGFETTLAFMLEAGFLGVMLFGWQRVSRGVHLFATGMVALGASLSAFWIMVANSGMQTPAGGSGKTAAYISTSFWRGLFNPDMPWGPPTCGSPAWRLPCWSWAASAPGISEPPAGGFFRQVLQGGLRLPPLSLPRLKSTWATAPAGRGPPSARQAGGHRGPVGNQPAGQGTPLKLFAWPNQGNKKMTGPSASSPTV